MLPIERQQQILEWLEAEDALSIGEIGKRLNVSDMTVYRDIKPLIEEKKIVKTSGGITLLEQESVDDYICTYCHKKSHSKLAVKLILTNKKVEHVCCMHCALLRYDDIRDSVEQILCNDFLQDTTVSGKMTTLVMNGDLNMNCCYPQVLPFASRLYAEKFQKGFGGELYSFEEGIEAIKMQMQGACCCKTK